MKTLEEDSRDLQSQDEQVRLFKDAWCFPTTRCSVSQCIMQQAGLPVSLQAQTTLKVYSMNSDRLNRNLETAGEENRLLQESNAQVRDWWWFSCENLLSKPIDRVPTFVMPAIFSCLYESLSHFQLRQQVEGWAERVSELEAEMSSCQVAHSVMLQDVANKDERITVGDLF